MHARADGAQPGQWQAREVAETEPPLAAGGLDLDVATCSSRERQLLAVRAELVLVELLRCLDQLADDAAPVVLRTALYQRWAHDQTELLILSVPVGGLIQLS